MCFTGHPFRVIEDDIYAEMYFGRKRPRLLKRWDRRQMVVTCSSFSKVLAPGFRVGWVVANGKDRPSHPAVKGRTVHGLADPAAERSGPVFGRRRHGPLPQAPSGHRLQPGPSDRYGRAARLSRNMPPGGSPRGETCYGSSFPRKSTAPVFTSRPWPRGSPLFRVRPFPPPTATVITSASAAPPHFPKPWKAPSTPWGGLIRDQQK